MEYAQWIADHWTDILFTASLVVAAAAAIARFTPTPKDDNAIRWFRTRILDQLAQNKGHAANKES